MGKVQLFEIRLSDSRVVYSPGEPLVGSVTVRLAGALQYRGKPGWRKAETLSLHLAGGLQGVLGVQPGSRWPGDGDWGGLSFLSSSPCKTRRGPLPWPKVSVVEVLQLLIGISKKAGKAS